MADRKEWPREAFGGSLPTAPQTTAGEAVPLAIVLEALHGIDLCVTDTEDAMTGWWDTSKGAEFGASVLEKIKEAAHPTTAAATTDNTALVEALRERDEELRSANYWRKRAMTAEAALSQPAAPQPTPEVEAHVANLEGVILDVERRLRGQGNRKWIPLHIEEAVYDIALRENAALARGSAADAAPPDTCIRPDCPTGDGLICPDCAQQEGGA